MEKYTDVLKPSIMVFNLVGLNPLKPFKKRVLCVAVIFLCSLFLTCMEYHYEQVDLFLMIRLLESAGTVLHASFKTITLIFCKKQAKHLIDEIDNFIPLSNPNPDIEQENKRTLTKIHFAVNSFGYLCCFTTFIMILLPILCHQMLLEMYVPPFIPYSIFAIIPSFVLFTCAVCSVVYDTFTGSLFFLLTFQFKLLNDRFDDINFEEVVDKKSARVAEKKLKFIVDHHNFLLKYLDSMNEFIQIPALAQCSMTVITACFELFVIKRHTGRILKVGANIAYLLGVVIEPVIAMGLPATLVTEFAGKIVWSAYQSPWTDSAYLPLRHYLIMIMTRGQIEATVSAGKMIIINLETCIRMYKTAFSFFTLLDSFV